MAFYTCPDCHEYVSGDDQFHAPACPRRQADEAQRRRRLQRLTVRAASLMRACAREASRG